MSNSLPLCTLDGLIDLTLRALGQAYAGVENGRVRDQPDRRTVRYYSTLGLLDRPAEMRGRTAYYGRRHLLQLTAIKRLQARGMSLVQIQQALLGLTTTELEALAQVPVELLPEELPQPQVEGAFWKAVPAAPEPPAPPDEGEPGWQSIALEKEVLLLLPLRRLLRAEDRQALDVAAKPLLELLRTRQLIAE